MQVVVGIRFKKAGKVYFFDPMGIELHKWDHVVAETARGLEFGEVATPPREVSEDQIVAPLKPVVRKATAEDILRVDQNEASEEEAFAVCQQKIAGHTLPMKLVDVEYTFDGSKIIFYFTAEGRIDFRDLVKDLAAVFRTRIELRQIGVRDEAKMLSGIGCCGRELCCATFLGDFAPVSIKMAKEQNLSLNPTKISGICGRLMCCLKYENESYENARQLFPAIGKWVSTGLGEGRVSAVNILRRVFTIETADKKSEEVDLADGFTVVAPPAPPTPPTPPPLTANNTRDPNSSRVTPNKGTRGIPAIEPKNAPLSELPPVRASSGSKGFEADRPGRPHNGGRPPVVEHRKVQGHGPGGVERRHSSDGYHGDSSSHSGNGSSPSRRNDPRSQRERPLPDDTE